MPAWNCVTFGDGTTGRLMPAGCMNRIVTPVNGDIVCWHNDAVHCDDKRQHETVITYYVDPWTPGETGIEDVGGILRPDSPESRLYREGMGDPVVYVPIRSATWELVSTVHGIRTTMRRRRLP